MTIEMLAGDMTLRDYFAAHAPDEPEEWFYRADNIQMHNVIGTHNPYKPCRGCLVGAECDGSDECNNYRIYKAKCKEWDDGRPIRWRWAWADAMLKARMP